jgi:hypothetical protein
LPYPNPMEFNGYTVTVATTEINPGNWQGTFTAQKPGEETKPPYWNPQYYETREQAEQETLALSRTMLGDII